MYSRISPIGIVDGSGNYKIINQSDLKRQRERTIERKAKKWQELYGNIDSDSFLKDSELKKIICANEILIQEQENRIDYLEKRVSMLSGDLNKHKRDVNKRITDLINALTRTFGEISSKKRVNVFVTEKKR